MLNTESREVEAVEMEKNPARYLAEVEGGAELLIVRGRTVVARIVPAHRRASTASTELLEELRSLRSRAKPGPEALSELVAEDRR